MELNLQFFGGRGANSSGASIGGNINSGYVVTTATGETMQWYFSKANGQTYYRNEIGEIPTPTPNGWTEKQMIDRVVANGGKAQAKSRSELIKEYTQFANNKKEMNDFLNQAYVSDRTFVKQSRALRIGRRAARRS